MAIDVATLINSLSRAEAYPQPAGAIEVHQTHISVVFLAGQFAYKIKKPVNLGFVDFSTVDRRKHFCEEEVRLNRRLAPQVYLGVVPVSEPDAQARDGNSLACASGSNLRVEGPGRVIEWAVKMKRLPIETSLESRLACGAVTAAQIGALAKRVAAFHADAERNSRVASFARFAAVAQNARENFTQAESLIGVTVSPSVYERIRALTEAHLERLHEVIDARAQRGVACDTHGDLRLEHVYLFPEEMPPHDLVIIDCIEFADRFRYADPVVDMAFLAMDLSFHGRRDLARGFGEAYFEASGDAEGRSLAPFYSAYRAVVRAKVEGMELGEKEIDPAERDQAAARAKAHWLLALGELETPPHRPAVVLVAGLPGSGKSTLARALAGRADFDVLRSDVVRKELASSHVGENIYTTAWTERTYSEMLARTEKMFWEGRRVLIDANFREEAWRRRFLDAARRWCVPVAFLNCRADPEVVRARLATRHNDASDADWQVYQTLQSSWEPLSDEVSRVTIDLNTSGPVRVAETSAFAALAVEGLV